MRKNDPHRNAKTRCRACGWYNCRCGLRYRVVVLSGGSYEVEVGAASPEEAKTRAIAAFHRWNGDTKEAVAGDPTDPVDSDVLTEAVSAEPIRAGA